ncbi:hypothetical protein AB0A66_02590 [Streptomyces longwoodensis]|uniref:hypothetical protein n=1 Tax=Streptomyces longwoodensis TaxID=68231 RepID=UPI003409651B
MRIPLAPVVRHICTQRPVAAERIAMTAVNSFFTHVRSRLHASCSGRMSRAREWHGTGCTRDGPGERGPGAGG